MRRPRYLAALVCAAVAAAPGRGLTADPNGGDLEEIRARGVLRHLGVPYARFVSGSEGGLDVDLVRAFAAHLGVRYEFVETEWTAALGDLTGRRVSARESDPARARKTPIRGDILATGLTVLPWRVRAVDYSTPIFPTQVWIVALPDSPVRPIVPRGDVAADVSEVRRRLAGRRVIGVPNTCLDPGLYGIESAGAVAVRLDTSRLDEVAPALLAGQGDLALLDVADAVLAFEKWPGRFKVIGPVSPIQDMAAAFRKDSPRLRAAFDAFLAGAIRDGTYDRLVATHFPRAPELFPAFFGARR